MGIGSDRRREAKRREEEGRGGKYWERQEREDEIKVLGKRLKATHGREDVGREGMEGR